MKTIYIILIIILILCLSASNSSDEKIIIKTRYCGTLTESLDLTRSFLENGYYSVEIMNWDWGFKIIAKKEINE